MSKWLEGSRISRQYVGGDSYDTVQINLSSSDLTAINIGQVASIYADLGIETDDMRGLRSNRYYDFLQLQIVDIERAEILIDGRYRVGGDQISIGSDIADHLAGDENDNLLVGLGSNDTLVAGAGKDTLYGGGDNDLLYGDAGNDILDGGTGTDSMYGGTGNDQFYVDSASDRVFENAGEGADFVYATTSSLTLSANIERLIFTDTGNHVGCRNALDNRLNGNVGNDKFVLDAGGADIFSGGSGSDSFDARSAANGVSINLITGVHGGDAAGDTFASIEKFFGSTVEDDFMRTGAARADFAGFGGNDTLIGGSSVDRISGGDGDDILFGGSASDTLQGGGDNDTLNGGGGRDLFLYVNAAFGQDTITDFQDGIDRMRVFSAVADDISDFTITDNGTSTVRVALSADPINFIDINGISGSNVTIDANDFLFY
ncbi:calcium-binding protein [Pseudahrensia aquimaris]|uniref:Calcium-binding protein n=1 Tax=Pseudahrensia aquimaris TaxID=744461 RepID=A0ABW3FGN2_9HYPH